MFRFLFAIIAISSISFQAFAAKYQNNLAPEKGQTYCKVIYSAFAPKRTLDLNVGDNGYDVADLEKYDIVTGEYSKIGKIAIHLAKANTVNIGFTGESGLKIEANGLAIDNDKNIFEFDGAQQVMAKVIFEVGDLIRVSCASNPY